MDTFQPGDKVKVYRTFYPHLSESKEYTVVEYQPEHHDYSGRTPFTWPAYLKVADEDGVTNTYHAHRFYKV